MTAIRAVWSARLLNWHHWRADRLMKAYRRHSNALQTEWQDYVQTVGPVIDEHIQQYLDRLADQLRDVR